MKTIIVTKGKFGIPAGHELSATKKRLTIKTAWCSTVERLDKDCWQTSIQQWFRSKSRGDKPFIPEGYIEVDGERYKTIEAENG